MNKKIMKQLPHFDGNMSSIRTASFSTTLSHCTSACVLVKNKSPNQKQSEQTEELFKQHNISHETMHYMSHGNRKKIEKIRLQKPTEVKQSIEMKAESQTQIKQLSKQISLPAVKQMQSSVLNKDVNSSPNSVTVSMIKKDETSSQEIHKKKTNNKKQHDGVSNWKNLCTTLNIDSSVRKTKPVKRPVPEDNWQQQADPKKVKSGGIWFDNVDKILIETNPVENVSTSPGRALGRTSVPELGTSDRLVKPDSFKGVTNCVAIDCEMVGVGPHGEESILARVSVVNHFGICLYDKFVLPREKVTDYRTFISGVTAEKLATGEAFTKVQDEVSKLIHSRILVGHAVHNDLKVLFLTHPHQMIRDTSLYKPFRELFNGRLPSLKKLTEKVLGVHVQEGQHSSVQDAQATMRLYTMYRQKWEKELRKERKIDRRKKNRRHKRENLMMLNA